MEPAFGDLLRFKEQRHDTIHSTYFHRGLLLQLSICILYSIQLWFLIRYCKQWLIGSNVLDHITTINVRQLIL